jgi:hypothetical protein
VRAVVAPERAAETADAALMAVDPTLGDCGSPCPHVNNKAKLNTAPAKAPIDTYANRFFCNDI